MHLPFLAEKEFCHALRPMRQRILSKFSKDNKPINYSPPLDIERALNQHKRMYTEMFAWFAFQYYCQYIHKKKLNRYLYPDNEFPRDLIRYVYASLEEANQQVDNTYLLNTMQIRKNICAHIDILENSHGNSNVAIILRKMRVNTTDPDFISLMAYKAWVASAERAISTFHLITINPTFIGPFSLGKIGSFFTHYDISCEVLKRLNTLDAANIHAISAARVPEIPKVDPMNLKNSVFNLPNLSGTIMKSLIKRNITTITPSIRNEFSWTPKQKQQIELQLSHKPIIHIQKLAQFLNGFRFPRFYIDFECASLDISPWECPPFAQMPFQYSMHVQKSASTTEKIQHHFYLHLDNQNDPLSDPRVGFAKSLAESFKQYSAGGSVIAHHANYERKVLHELGQYMRKIGEYVLSEILMTIREAIIDLEDVFKEMYIDPKFLGSTSLKKIQPVLAPTRSYKSLEGCVADGKRASDVYAMWVAQSQPAFRVHRKRVALLEYCRLDTLVMVDIIEFLENVVQHEKWKTVNS